MKLYLRSLSLIKKNKGIAIFLFLMAFVLSCLVIIEPFFFKEIINSLVDFSGETNFFDNIKIVFIFWGSIVLCNIIVQLLLSYNSSYLATKTYSFLWRDSFEHILSFSINFFDNHQLGKVVREFERGVDNLYSLYIGFFRYTLPNLFILLFLLPIIFYLNSKMALLIVSVIPILVFLIALGIKEIQKDQKISDNDWTKLSGILYDAVSNIFLVKSFTLVSRIFNKTDKLRETALDKQNKANKSWGMVIGLSRSIGLILNILVFLLGSVLYIRNEMSLGDIIMFIGFTSIIVNIFNSFFWNVLDYSWQREKIKALFDIIDTKPEIIDKEDSLIIGRAKGEIDFKNVSFSYKDGADAIKNISFTIKPGEVVAFVGHTGSGKTTTANLISRFYDVKSGKILLDSKNIKDINLDSLRKNIAIVFQENTFFNASVYDNLKIDDKVTKKDMEEALKKARVFDVINKNKKGVGQIIGEKGTKLSGGEKQRLSIARAILKDAPILILDEATSALDAKTENKIQSAISDLIKDKTTIIIAHRLSTIKKADRIFVFDHGNIIESGDFNSLMKKKGSFYELVSYQMGI
ncbi:MAG: ABC transporter transmembrane domain-containing protein [Candidatus Pacebacteria bacterium]|nr:ABC transporter transmembrane domain-containing protein [Candidatus Paceibacterota bacterium]